MCLLWSGLRMLDIKLDSWHLLGLVLAIILLLSPFSALDPSLWLSLGAVSVVFISAHCTRRLGNFWLRAVCVQIGLFVGLIPVSQVILGGFSAVAIFYNLVFIPLVSVLVVPLLFLGFVFMPIADSFSVLLFLVCDGLVSLMMRTIELTSSWHWIEAPILGLTILLLGFAVLVVRQKAAIAGIGLAISSSSYQTPPSWSLDVLDVGHGLAVVISKERRAILYDTGSGWEHGSFAQQLILPVIRAEGLSLDKLFVSHWDNDHSGGVKDIFSFAPMTQGFSSQLQLGFLPCVQGMHLWWQGLRLKVLWPTSQVYRAYNPHSCVVEVSDKKHRVLLTGDIDLLAEYQLQRHLRKVDLLIVPHHGSNTSSSHRFVELTSPKVAIASVSGSGKWQLPAQKVRTRYEQNGARWLDTGQHGRVVVRFFDQSMQVSPYRGRQSDAWYRQILRKGVE
ncbi:DNA internalization-related competence protein [Vibrio ishigakensis]|uniref:DNA internalization-related competence protein n=1 Tax=Vibrio ishigakensis TaxID=1481914 RepID=A0A0B8Q9U9_9VIBR|nr:DNA internalization-related competence protein [Vibrio ishigakensis]